MTIAVDFDGTIVEHRYPQIGKERLFAVSTLRQLQKDIPDLHLILWTVREGELLEQAVAWCAERGLTFYAVNSNYPGELPVSGDSATGCRKVTADIYIDDRNFGHLASWPDIYQKLSGKTTDNQSEKKTSGFWDRFFGCKEN